MSKFLVISQVFPPDPAAVGQYFDEAAKALRDQGAEVTVLTANRGYDNPDEKFEAFENREGVAVHRLAASSFGKSSMSIRLFGQLSFILQCFVRGLFTPKLTDLLVSTSPPMCGFVAVLIGWLRPSIRVHYWLMDLNPDQAISLKVFKKNHPLVLAMDWLNRRVLGRANSVIALDRFMQERFCSKSLTCNRDLVSVLPPWPMDQHLGSVPHGENLFRKEHGWSGKFVVMFSGNHSWVHPLSTILDVAEQLKNDDRFVFAFIGGGKGKAEIDQRIEQISVEISHGTRRSCNIVSLPYQPLEVISHSLSAADLHVVSLGDNMSGIVHPCKVYGALAIGRPVLALAPEDSYLSDIFDDAEFGCCFRHGDTNGVADYLKALARKENSERMRIGDLAKEHVARHFDRESLIREFTSILLKN